MKAIVARAQAEGRKVVFTNGCFDLLHCGHLHLLGEAKKMGDLLVVAVNSDASVKQIKGPDRPVLPESDRAELLAALEVVDYVTSFSEPDPSKLIEELRPDVLVKGGDWSKEQVVGATVVEQNGGKVAVIPYLQNHSTTKIIETIRGK
ncbi:MAG: D-glycero-beta-D-manno-heptose 1-phosphate adenylyltransferase [Candidatus Binatia bacterium]